MATAVSCLEHQNLMEKREIGATGATKEGVQRGGLVLYRAS